MTFPKVFSTLALTILKSELQCLGREIRKKFQERIVEDTFVFSLVDVHLEKIVYNLLPFRIVCHCFFFVRGRRNVEECNVCSRFFVNDSDIASKIDQEFLLTKNGFSTCLFVN